MEPLKIEGHDEAIIGIAHVWHEGAKVATLIYDRDAIIETLMSRDNMDHDEAAEFVEFNIEGAYMGESTPIIVWELP